MGGTEKIAFCFPGQIQEIPILSKDHPLVKDPLFRAWTDQAEKQTGMELWKLMSGERDEDQLPLKLQLMTYLFSVIHFHRLSEKGWIPEILTEHSMGIYAALTASEAITFEEGVFITHSIGKLLEEEGALCPGMMASIIGLPLEEIQKIISTLDGYQLAIANYNGSMHFVISGEAEGVQKAMELALNRRALSVSKLSFHTALHSPALSPLRGKIRKILKDIEVRPFRYPILNHWTVQLLNRHEVRDFLSEEIARPVYWVRCVEKCIRDGIRRFIEVGKESSLTKLIRWADREVEAISTEELLFSGGQDGIL